MAITFPVPWSDFAAKLKIEEGSGGFSLTPNDEVTGLGSGQMLVSEFFPSVWRVSVQTVLMDRSLVKQLAALARGIEKKGGAFLMDDRAHAFPQLDPKGETLGASVVTIAGIGGSGRSVQLQDMPSLYRLRAGDRLSITDGTSVYYGEFLEDANANAGGLGPFADVFPELPPWAEVGMAVTLARPTAMMQFVPGSVAVSIGLLHGSIAFEAVEDVR